jgi:alkylation response protein AidB-like acyl-CoA dehydrogenase
MYSLDLSAEQLEIRDTVRDFVAREIKTAAHQPARLESAERRLPPAIYRQASQLGLRTLALAEEHGGAGADSLTSCMVAEELAMGDVDLAVTLVQTSTLAHELYDRAMDAAQRARFLPAFTADHGSHLALAVHEPGAETALGVNYHRPAGHAARFKSTATRAGNGDWVINGAKSFIVNAPIAKLFAVTVGSEAGGNAMTLLVPHETAGLTVRASDASTGWFHGDCGDLAFKDCRVPGANLLGAWPAAEIIGTPQMQAVNLGVGRAAYEAALDYAKLRVQGGRRIIEHQAIGALLAGIAIKLEAARNVVWQAAWAADHAEARAARSLSDLPFDLVAKAHTAEAMHEVTLRAAEVFGAMGVMRDVPMQKYVADARRFLHAGVSNDEAKLRIAEHLAGYQRPAAAARGS